MKTQFLSCIILSLAWSLIGAGLPPEGSFRLTVNEIVGTGHCRVLTLKVQARATAEMMAIRFPDGGGEGSCTLTGSSKSKMREGEIVLATMRSHPESPVETTTVLQTSAKGSHVSLPASYELPSTAQVDAVFSLSVTNGLYELNRPLLIGKRNGEPIRLVVGRWNWEQLSLKK
jgi:hypothetical protein